LLGKREKKTLAKYCLEIKRVGLPYFLGNQDVNQAEERHLDGCLSPGAEKSQWRVQLVVQTIMG
jgi:hypothetical protein